MSHSSTVVSVVMAVYNGERFVGEAIRSVLAQTYSQWELVVVDDGSTDSTADVVSEFEDARIRLVRQQQSGVAPARNKGIAESSGEFLAFLDHDDTWFPDKLATQMTHFDDPDVGVVGSFMTYLSDRGPTRAVSGEVVDGRQDRLVAGKLMPFALSSMVARSDLVRKLGDFDAGLARVAQVEDLDLLSRCSREARVETVPRPLGYYRVHANAASFRTFHRMRAGSRFVQARIRAREVGSDLRWDEWDDTPDRGALRKDRANFLYRTGAFQMVSGHRLRGAASLLTAATIAPGYVLPRLRRQLMPGRSA